jgi:hypothetical protein
MCHRVMRVAVGWKTCPSFSAPNTKKLQKSCLPKVGILLFPIARRHA